MGWPVYQRDRVRPDRLSEMFALNAQVLHLGAALPSPPPPRPWPRVGKGLGAPPHAPPIGRECTILNTRAWRGGGQLRITPGARMFATEQAAGSPSARVAARIVNAEEKPQDAARGRSTGRGKARPDIYAAPPDPFHAATAAQSPRAPQRTPVVDILSPQKVYLAAEGQRMDQQRGVVAEAIRAALRSGIPKHDIAAALTAHFGKAPSSIHPKGRGAATPPTKPLKPLRGFAVRHHKNYLSRPRSGGSSKKKSSRGAPSSAGRSRSPPTAQGGAAATAEEAASLQQLLRLHKRDSSVAMQDYDALRPVLEELYNKHGIALSPTAAAAPPDAPLVAPLPPSIEPDTPRPRSADSDRSDVSWYEARRREAARRRSSPRTASATDIPVWRTKRGTSASARAPAAPPRRPKTAEAGRQGMPPRPPSATRDDDIAPFTHRPGHDDALADYDPTRDRNTPSPGFLDALVSGGT